MSFTWPDPISLVADVVTFIGIPVLVYSTWSLYRQFEKDRQPKGVSEDCVSFYDVNEKCAINLVPFKQLAVIPRAGDYVYLPGETDAKRNYGGGKYEVVAVQFHYREDSKAHPFIPATTSAIEVMVRKIASYD